MSTELFFLSEGQKYEATIYADGFTNLEVIFILAAGSGQAI
ncbi:glycoside hydrolase family 97 C-terminal domain-containing protein [Ancylomarina sp. 16SWW S1-10-2]|nr:glycoside hydrolase family 97 C-terminal domain-containing protein [Ancylomarina sp. 16SWW S1-10-2]